MSDISDLQQMINKFIQDRDWDQFHNPKDMALSLTLEASEVLEHFQWKNEAEVDKYIATHRDDVADELADVLYWVVHMADKLDIDILAAFNKKMLKNEQKYPVSKAKSTPKKYTELEKE